MLRKHACTRVRLPIRARDHVEQKGSVGVGRFIHKCSSEGVNGCACERTNERARQHPRFSSRTAVRSSIVRFLSHSVSSLLSLSVFFSAISPVHHSLSPLPCSLSLIFSSVPLSSLGPSTILFPLSTDTLLRETVLSSHNCAECDDRYPPGFYKAGASILRRIPSAFSFELLFSSVCAAVDRKRISGIPTTNGKPTILETLRKRGDYLSEGSLKFFD